MRRICLPKGWAALGLSALMAGPSLAQPPRLGPGRGPEGPPRGGPPGRVLEVLDANDDRVISADEIQAAAAALLKLDANGDGQLTAGELRPPRGEGRVRGRRGSDRPDVGDRPQRGRDREERRDRREGDERERDERAGDRDRDARERGSRERDERRSDDERRERDVERRGPEARAPEARGPENRAERWRERFADRDVPGRPEGPPRDVRRGGFGPPPRGPGDGAGRFSQRPSPAEFDRGPRNFDRGPGRFGGGPPGWARGREGVPNTERFVDRAFRFDANDDGQLSREEFAQFVEAMRRGRPEPPRPPSPDRDADERPEERREGSSQ